MIAALLTVLWLLWTNPPDGDIATVQFFATMPGDTLRSDFYRGRPQEPGGPVRLVPGGQDSVLFALPCGHTHLTWVIWCVVADTAGNVSEPSNRIVVQGPIAP